MTLNAELAPLILALLIWAEVSWAPQVKAQTGEGCGEDYTPHNAHPHAPAHFVCEEAKPAKRYSLDDGLDNHNTLPMPSGLLIWRKSQLVFRSLPEFFVCHYSHTMAEIFEPPFIHAPGACRT